MNLDVLFQQIEFTEKQAREKRHLIQQAKVDINRSYEKINQIKEELSTAKMKLETKVQHLCEKQFYLEILKKREDSLEKLKAELTNQKSSFLKILADAKRKMTEEEDNFTGEVTEFNNEYGLTSNRNLLIKKKVKTEINDLENEAALLKNEMESMEHKNVQLNALQLQKDELKQDLFTLQSELKDLENVIREAEKMTKDLEAEKVQVTEKPQTDPECLSLSPLHAYSNEPKTECLQGSQSNLEEDQKTAPWVEGQFLSFRKNSDGTQSTAELPNAIRASADWLYNLPQSLTEMEWIGHNSLLGSEQETTPFFKCGHNQGKDKKENKKKMFYLSQQTITKRQLAPSATPTITRLKKELENCKDDDWESICETLRTEIEILQMNLSQKKSSDK